MLRMNRGRILLPIFLLAFLCSACNTLGPTAPPCPPPPADHIVIVVEENHANAQIIGNPDAPFINQLAQRGVLFTQSFAVTHPSQPNYLALFAGDTLGITDNSAHPHDLFTTPNLASKLLDAGRTFTGYADGLPEPAWDGPSAGDADTGSYQRKHNPWVNWQDATTPLPPNKLPLSINQPFTSWPARLDDLPTVAFVVPNQKHDMHDGTVAEADAWLESALTGYLDWADTHNSLLILTWDEDDGLALNNITTIFVGPMVQPGRVSGIITHYTVLRTIEEMLNLPHTANTDQATPVPCNTWLPH